MNAFYHYPNFKDCLFSDWEDIKNFLRQRYVFIIQDLENIRGKCDGKQAHDNKLLDVLKKEVLINNEFETLGKDLMSPKV